jgi:hypothetical protein
MLGVGFLYLIECPVFDFKDDESGVLAKEDEIRLSAVDIRQVLGQVFAIRFGGVLQESVEMMFSIWTEVFNIVSPIAVRVTYRVA